MIDNYVKNGKKTYRLLSKSANKSADLKGKPFA
jgi:hypothetical protein